MVGVNPTCPNPNNGGRDRAVERTHTTSVQYKELKLGSHSGHAKTNLSGHCAGHL